jgi:hypothetical protein
VNVRRVFAHLAFACFLLLSQQLGIVHAISHISADSSLSDSKREPLPKELQCEQCLSFAGIGSGLTGSPARITQLVLPNEAPAGKPFTKPLPPAGRIFDSRAPPVRS